VQNGKIEVVQKSRRELLLAVKPALWMTLGISDEESL
jgi:hypothetical protein